MFFHIFFKDEEVRKVKVKGEDVPIKTVTLEDTTAKAKVTLRRDVSSTEVHPGDYVMITDVVINSYRNETSLSTTSKSKVEVCMHNNNNNNNNNETCMYLDKLRLRTFSC